MKDEFEPLEKVKGRNCLFCQFITGCYIKSFVDVDYWLLHPHIMCCNSFPEFQFQKHGVSDTVDQLLSKNPAGLTEDGIQLVKARVLDTAQGFFETTFTSNQYATSQLLSSFYIAWWMLSVTLLIFSTSELKHLNVLSWSQSVTCPSLVKFVIGSQEISSLWQAFLSWYGMLVPLLS